MGGNEVHEPVFTVTQITEFVKNVIESSFRSVIIEGEISNFTASGPGHLYLTLKDSGAQISGCMFRNAAQYLTFRPKNGDKVRVYGSLSVYAPRGNYQIIISKMEMAGVGDLLQMLEERKRRLYAEGLFDPARKKPLPRFPKTIGIVSSPTGAGLRDILKVARARNPKININIFPALVQGDSAAPTICKMIEIANFYKMCDVLIVGRGGGSVEDLLPFSEECVVRAVAASEIPVVTAVGHEIDIALCDYAADVRASTPTNAAEIVVPETAQILQTISMYKNDLYQSIKGNVDKKIAMVRSFRPENMMNQFRNIELPYLNRFENAKKEIVENLLSKINEKRNIVAQCTAVLESASPSTIFERGYAMVRDKNTGAIVRDAANLKPGTEVEVVPAKGRFTAIVNTIGE